MRPLKPTQSLRPSPWAKTPAKVIDAKSGLLLGLVMFILILIIALVRFH